MNCYICLEPTDHIIQPRCSCSIYSHVSCFKNWIKYKDSCLICNRKVSKYKYEHDITLFIFKIFMWTEPIDHYFRETNPYLGFFFFLVLSFIITIVMILPLYILSFISFLQRSLDSDYQVINIKNDFYNENID